MARRLATTGSSSAKSGLAEALLSGKVSDTALELVKTAVAQRWSTEDDLAYAIRYLARLALLVRADLVDFWRLAMAAEWRPARHFLLYPNPYPKSTQLKKRWQGHPVFPAILALGGVLELRSNWAIFVQEFALGVKTLRGLDGEIDAFTPEGALMTPFEQTFLTPFEQKYVESGQTLWRYRVDLSTTGLDAIVSAESPSTESPSTESPSTK